MVSLGLFHHPLLVFLSFLFLLPLNFLLWLLSLLPILLPLHVGVLGARVGSLTPTASEIFCLLTPRPICNPDSLVQLLFGLHI